MRIRRLDLDLFGHFAGQSIDFGSADTGADFHVVYGPNEAGKTTLMEGFLRLLYGFPHRDPYDFQHQRKNLRVSGLLDLDGETRHLIRRPTRGASLSDATGAALPDAMLQAHLGGLDLEDYRNLLCLDDDTIERGGEEIAGSKGDIGRLLFAAAAGISDLSAVLDEARAQADALYRKRGSTSRVAHLKKEIAEITARIRDSDVTAGDYKRLKRAWDAASTEEAALREERARLTRARETLRARIAALPLLDDWAALAAQIAPCSAYPEGLDVQAEDLVQLLADQAQAKADIARLTADLSRLDDDLATGAPDTADLKLAADLSDLEDLRDLYKGALRDLERRRRDLSQLEHDMKRKAGDLGAPEGTDPLALVHSPAQLAELAETLEAVGEAHRRVATEQAELDHLADRVVAGEAAAESAPSEAASEADIGALLDQFDIDRLVSDHAAARQAIASAREVEKTRLDALSQSAAKRFETLPDCPIRLDEAQGMAADWAALGDTLARATDARKTLDGEVEVTTAQIAQLTAAGGVLDDAGAAEARATRDRLWDAHRAALDAQSAEAFKAALDHVDAVSDTRLAHARTLGQLRELAQNLAMMRVRARQARADEEALATARRDLGQRVADHAQACGLPAATTPVTLTDWIARHAEAARAQADVARQAARHAPVLDKADRLRSALTALIGSDGTAFDDLLAMARRRAKAAQTMRDSRARAQATQAELRAEQTRRRARLDRLTTAAGAARQAWNDLVAACFGGAIDAAILARSLTPLTDLRELDANRRPIARQVAAMEADQTAFTAGVAALMAARSPALASASDPLADFEALTQIANLARSARDRLTRLQAEKDAAITALVEAQARLDRIDHRVALLAQGFDATIPTATLPELREAVRIAEATIAARARKADLESALQRDLGATDMDRVRIVLAGHAKPDLEAEAATVDAELRRIDDQLSSAIERRSSAARDLDAVTSDADIARLTEARATLELQLEDAVLQHLELSLGHRLADDAIRRYRDVHRSGMMAATELAFAELTGGAYQTLRSEVDGTSEILVAVDATGRAKQAADMSKGTRFQLYLALRAAAYQQLVAQGTRLPFFCDDIFETFDDTRTGAACQVMARIAASGQAIYLTHHAHVVEIAREVCGDAVQVHHLGG